MATFVLIHGAGDVGWYWHLVQAELRRHGHEAVAPDLPCEDSSATLDDYAETVIQAIAGRRDLVVVGQSYGGFTAPLVAERARADLTGSGDPFVAFYHDVPRLVAEQAMSKERDESDAAYQQPWPLTSWPDVTTRFVLCTEDRFFPPEFLRAVVRDRLAIVPDEITAGHCVALSRPVELAGLLIGFVASTDRGSPQR